MRFADFVRLAEEMQHSGARRARLNLLVNALRDVSPVDASSMAALLLRARLFEPHGDVAAGSAATLDRTADDAKATTLTCDIVARALVEIDVVLDLAMRDDRLDRLLETATPEERRWIVAASDVRPFDRQAFDLIVSATARSTRVTVGSLRRAATLSGSLPFAVMIAFDSGESGLQAVELQPGRPIPPTTVDGLERPDALLLHSRSVIVEWNLRADRVQVHRKHGEVTVYDSGLRDITASVPTVVEQIRTFGADDLILDCWVRVRRSNSPSVSTAGSTLAQRVEDELAAGRALFFDVLFHRTAVIDVPLAGRRALLASIVPEASTLPILEMGDLRDVSAAMNECYRMQHDGLVMKPSDSPYEGGFVASSWREIGSVPIVHLAVTAAERGTGGRAHLLSTVHLAARDDRDRLIDLGKTARGLTDETIRWQTAAFAHLTLDGEEGGTGKVFIVRPEIVAVVAIDGVQPSDRTSIGLSIDQPRILGYLRGSADVTTIMEIREIAERTEQRSREASLVDPEHRTGAPVLPRLPDVGNAHAPPMTVVLEVEPEIRPGAERLAQGERLHTRPTGESAARRLDFAKYEEPVLPVSTRPQTAVMLSRVAAAVWALGVLVAALIDRSGGPGQGGTAVATVGPLGIVVVVLLMLSGWAWSDQLVRTLLRLDGRRPGRTRCVSAWLAPAAVSVIIALIVVPLDPTEPADIRPALIVPVFAFAMWRPYALIRRILTTLTRARSDGLVASAYILDTLGFGLLWWRLAQWRDGGGQVTRGEVDVLVGTAGAVVAMTLVSLAIWLRLQRSVRRGVAHRRSSQRTRYEHRMLRLQGVDPTDPDVWWALVQRRTDEQRHAEASSARESGPRESLPNVDQFLDEARREHSVVFRRLDAVELGVLEERLRSEFTAILATGEVRPISDRRAEPADGGTPPIGVRSGQPESAPSDPERPDEILDAGDDDPIESLRRRVGWRTPEPVVRSDIETLIHRAGTVEIESALADHRQREQTRQVDVKLSPSRLLAVESTRLALVGAFALLTLVAGWMVWIAMSSAATSETGDLSAAATNDLELARKLFMGLLTVGYTIVPVWALTMQREARAAKVDEVGGRRVRFLALISIAACVAGFLVDGDRGNISALLAIPIMWCAVSAGLSVEPVRDSLDMPAGTLLAWVTTLPAMLVVAWLAGLTSTIESAASLQRLAFTTILLALGGARITAMSHLSSVDLEDQLRVLRRGHRAS